jgi:FKBP-type peptidyl-prolyl cis-trans isomerase 2
MRRVKAGDTVSIEYIGTLDNGHIFHSTEGTPLTFTIGADQVFAALEQAVLGMAVGEARNVLVPASDAYGPRLPENLLRVDRSLFPAERTLRIAEKLQIEIGGEPRVMRVRAVEEEMVLLDGNHDLAGCDLTFALQVCAIEE